ncbi:MAG: asparagine synthase (glutamine-hydrolyzing) [Gammaproteobacteria bacterium TMED95]|nr:MAG: asparagine synthase (glutamine-hydrolyzing) [Gammaproteobacteria bacterium TMED95]|tara:strand:- start:2482 stop:4416 length:1935 start_codon:yes stop_codon:yes gene_type:complete
MCGIIGAVNFNDEDLGISQSALSKQMSIMGYRGPDAQEQWHHPSHPVRFGHLRLSILDTRPEGNQPMHLETDAGTLSMVFNGEVYNYVEIREELEALTVNSRPKYTFKTTTDSEVILAAYAEWGGGCVDKFNGMFAIAIYNDKTRSLFLLRDRIGIKPLYYALTDDGIIFGSEVKAIRPLLKTLPSLQLPQIKSYMQYGYGIGEDTCDDSIKRLLPGHAMTINSCGNVIYRYWKNKRPSKGGNLSRLGYDEAVAKARDIFDDSLRLRLRADVDIGVFLSGGLDSSAVVAGLHKLIGDKRQIKTFSVKYDIGEYGKGYDESVYAQQVSRMFNTDHHTYTMTAEDFESYIPEYVRTMDEPVTEAAAISLHFVSELAKKHVTVVLSGEGADEIFGGYDLYLYMEMLEKIRRIVTPAGASMIKGLAQRLLPAGNKVRKYAELVSVPFEERYRGISVYDESYHQRLLTSNIVDASDTHQLFAKSIMDETQGQDLLSRMLEFDTRTWLVDDLLIKADRMSMGSSLELRVPFLDYRMVEFAGSLPPNYKIRRGDFKSILKDMFKDELPPEILRRKKLGFPTPLCLMFQGPLKEYIQRRLLDGNKLGFFFNQSEIEILCQEHFSKKADHHRILFQLIILAEWVEQNHPSYLK